MEESGTEGMVLDEKALEAMLARQRATEREPDGVESVRTERTDEFEVYERADGVPRTGAGVRAPLPPSQPKTAIPPSRPLVPTDGPPGRPRQAAIPPSRPLVPVDGSDDFEELPGRDVPTAFQPPEAFRDGSDGGQDASAHPQGHPPQSPEGPQASPQPPQSPEGPQASAQPQQPADQQPPAEPRPTATPRPPPAAPRQPVASSQPPGEPVAPPVAPQEPAAPPQPPREPATPPQPSHEPVASSQPSQEPAAPPPQQPTVSPPPAPPEAASGPRPSMDAEGHPAPTGAWSPPWASASPDAGEPPAPPSASVPETAPRYDEPPRTQEPLPPAEHQWPDQTQAQHDRPFHAEPSAQHEAQEPSQTEPTQVEPPRRRRPQVWPPIGDREPTGADVPSATASSAGTEAGEGTMDQTATRDDDVPQPGGPAQERLPADRDEPAATDARIHAPTPHAFPATTASGEGCRLAVVQAKFNAEITDMMADLAISHARKAGAEVTHHATVPGVYDLPLMVQSLARRDDVDAVVVIGCVVQGETRHDELITHATAKTLQEVSLATQTPIGFGIIGPGMTWEQAEARVVNGKHAVEAVLVQWATIPGCVAP